MIRGIISEESDVKRILYILVALVTVFCLVGCGHRAPAQYGRLQVVTSFNAMTELVKAVGADKVSVYTIIPDGTEPHDFELKPEDVRNIADAQVFVYNGLGMEAWARQAIEAGGNDQLVTVEAAKGIAPISLAEDEPETVHPGEEKHHHENGGHEDHHHDQSVDPHAWLSLRNAIVETQNICDGLVEADPTNAAYYQANADRLIHQLQALDQDYAAKFSQVLHRDFVTGHAAFGYLCRDYGLHQSSVEDVFAEGEPNAQQLAQLVDFARANAVKVIFAEEMASPAVSQTLAREVGAQVETLYTLESNEDDLSYLERMRSNLDTIYRSMQ